MFGLRQVLENISVDPKKNRYVWSTLGPRDYLEGLYRESEGDTRTSSLTSMVFVSLSN